MGEKRIPLPTMLQLQQSYEDSKTALQSALSANVEQMQGDVTELHKFAQDVKSSFQSFCDISRDVVRRLIADGAIEEAQHYRRERRNLRLDSHETIDLINAIAKRLNADIVSNVDSQSVSIRGDSKPELDATDALQPAKEVQKAVSDIANREHCLSKETERLRIDANASPRRRLSLGDLPDLSTSELVTSYLNNKPLLNPQTLQSTDTNVSANDNQNAAAVPGTTRLVSSNNEGVQRGYLSDSFPLCSFVRATDGPRVSFKLDNGNVHSSAAPLTRTSATVGSGPYYSNVSMPYTTEYERTYSDCPRSVPMGNSFVDPGGLPFGVTSSVNSNRPSPWRSNMPNTYTGAYSAYSQDFSVSQHLIKQELFKKAANPFTGNPSKFHPWVNLINNRVHGLNLNALDMLTILASNTEGKPLKLVEDHIAAGGADPEQTLRSIWTALYVEYGSSTRVSAELLGKLKDMPQIKYPSQVDKLREFTRMCRILECNMSVSEELRILNISSGSRLTWSKLPDVLQGKWRTYGNEYERHNRGIYPPFSVFVRFLQQCTDELGNPHYDRVAVPTSVKFNVLKTSECEESFAKQSCEYHDTTTHSIINCKAFAKLPFVDRRKFAFDKKLCFSCLGNHMRSKCALEIKCLKCKGKHIDLMHNENFSKKSSKQTSRNGTKKTTVSGPVTAPQTKVSLSQAQSLCTETNSCVYKGRSCSKTVLVDVSLPTYPNKYLRCYCIIDEQSNSSFIDKKILDFFNVESYLHDYTLTTMSGFKQHILGRKISDLSIKGVGESRWYLLPDMLTNDSIPNGKDEIATESIVASHEHIAKFAKYFPSIDEDAEVLLLLGRNCGDVMATKCYGTHAPFVHHTALGWAMVGSICPYDNSLVESAKAFKTHIDHEHYFTEQAPMTKCSNLSNSNIFETKDDDNLLGLSLEDSRFLKLMEESIHINECGNLTMPLPFKSGRPSLPNNRGPVYNRTHNTLMRLKKDLQKLTQCLEVMGKYISANHVEVVPESEIKPKINDHAWWVPVFPVTHPKKGKVRIVFDSSASFQGTNLNANLLQGPDHNNCLRGVLLRFREHEIGFAADIESMFHTFHLDPDDKDYLRFYWFKANDPALPLVQYRARVHIFGNRPSPAIANYGLRYTTSCDNVATSTLAKNFINTNFYVDDALGSCDSVLDAVTTLKDSIELLGKFNIRLRKLTSSSAEVLREFPESEIDGEINLMEFENTPMQKTLGLAWDVASDKFVMKVNLPDRPFTKRGVLSVVNTLFDPMGIASPVTLHGRLLQRTLMPPKKQADKELFKYDWDDPLPSRLYDVWESWKVSLSDAGVLKLNRCYTPCHFAPVNRRELHVFSDASQDAIGHVIYMVSVNYEHAIHVAFVLGSSKVAPRAATSIPRLELCAALEAAISTRELLKELDVIIDSVRLYTDSRVVLGYLNNTERRFSLYVSRRISLLLQIFPATHWQYIPTTINPADIATRPHSPQSLLKSTWLIGPQFLWSNGEQSSHDCSYETAELPEVLDCGSKVLQTSSSTVNCILQKLIQRTNCWLFLLSVFAKLLYIATVYLDKVRQRLGVQLACRTSVSISDSLNYIILCVQLERYNHVICSLTASKSLSESCALSCLSPFLDSNGVMRVGGRLQHSGLTYTERHPAILPADHPVSSIIVGHYHNKVCHQGRHITHGAIRQAGVYIHKGGQLIRKYISNCVTCRKLRDDFQIQQMSNLPPDRLEETPPFLHSGVDVFGPFTINEGVTTRRKGSTKKVWALLLTCLVSRAIHIEPLPALDTSSFINALRRFFAVRGNCKLLRSDQGSNFLGALNQLDSTISLAAVQSELVSKDCRWELNPPHASHFGGVWERKVGSVKRILDGALKQLGMRMLSRDEFSTLLAEAASIVNNTPLWDISSNAEDPLPLSSAMLLTLRDGANCNTVDAATETDLLAYGKARWRRVQYLSQQFWVRWRAHYLHTLQERRKWQKVKKSLRVGDIVLLRDKTRKRNYWPMGRISATKVSNDGLVRSVLIDTVKPDSSKVQRSYERSIGDVILLIPSESSLT